MQQIGFEKAVKATERLLGFYPQSPASDPQVFMSGVAMLLANYPANVVEASLSPLSGIPSKFKFMPSIAELKEDLESRLPPWQPEVPPLALPAPDMDRSARPSYEQLKAKYGENWGLSVQPRKQKSFRSVAEIAADIAKTFGKAAE